MLNLVRQALVENRIIDPDADLDFNITTSVGDTITMEVCASGRAWYYVKTSRFSDLESQFERYHLAHEYFPECTPESLVHYRKGDWSLLILRSISHRPLRIADLLRGSSCRLLGKELAVFFEATRQKAAGLRRPASHLPQLETLQDYFSRDIQANSKLLAYLQNEGLQVWQDSEYIPQHGDFVLNNLGVANGRMVIFDWEDYGETSLNGFDLCLLSLSVAGLNEQSALSLYHSKHAAGLPCASFLPRCCEASGLSHEAFVRAIPAYLIVFRYLKRNYSGAIRHRIDGILDRILV